MRVRVLNWPMIQATYGAQRSDELMHRVQERLERAQREASQRAQEVDAALFRRTVGRVNGLPSSDRVVPQTPRPLPVPASRQADEQAVLKSSLSDEFDVESLLETDASLSWRRTEIGIDVAYRQQLTLARLHQRPFRAAVLRAYETSCAVCSFRHGELLDAAHIQEDSRGGQPVVSNGLSLCKMHHGA